MKKEHKEKIIDVIEDKEFKKLYKMNETEIKEELEKIIKKIIISTGEGRIEDCIGFGGKKYSEDYYLNFKGKELYSGSYYNVFNVDSDDMEDNISKQEMIKLLIDLNKAFMEFNRDTAVKRRKLFKLYFK